MEAPVNHQRPLRTASIFKNGRNQAIRIPVGFELPGNEVTIEQDGDTLIVRPKKVVPTTFAELFASWEAFPDFPDVDDSDLPPDIPRIELE
jgi:antitoxin VapB